MSGLGPFRRQMLISRTLACVVIEKILVVVIPSVDEESIGLRSSDLLLVALCRSFLGFPITWVEFFSPDPLSFDSTFCIERSWLTICAKMIDNFELLLAGHITVLVDIVTLSVLPGVTRVAVHRVPIVLSKAADALYDVVFHLITGRICRILWMRRD